MTYYLPLHRAQFAMRTFITSALSGVDVGWAKQGVQRKAGSLVTLEQLAGPTRVQRGRSRRVIEELPDTVTLTVTDATEGVTVWAEVNGYVFTTNALAGDTVTTLRDRFLGVLTADAGLPLVTATSSGADGILLTPDEAGGLWRLRIAGPLSQALGTLQTYSVTDIYRRCVWTVQAFTRSTAPRKSAHALLSQLTASAEDPEDLAVVLDSGVSLESIGTVVDLTAQAGPSWQSMASMDLALVLKGVKIRAVTTIDTAVVTTTGRAVEGGTPLVTDVKSVDLT